MTLRAPFPWFGGKSRAAHLVWPRFGDVPNYVEPFAGSLAVLLARPTEPRVETVNDKDAYLANFWRSLQADPGAVAAHADWPVNEADLHARHRWLVSTGAERLERIKTEPDYYDAKVAGWWVWGQCLWIGSGWCSKPEWTGRVNAGRRSIGTHAARRRDGDTSEQAKRPCMGRGARGALSSVRRPNMGGAGGGQGVHAPRLVREQIPSLSGDGSGSARGLLSDGLQSLGLVEYLRALQARLRRVRVCCGDWSRIVTPAVTTYIGTTGVFLDPPYKHDLRSICYNHDEDISSDVRAWALAHGDDPKLRIALCGYEGEHEMPRSWECVSWTAGGGYGRSERGKGNRHLERIWFSPNCLKVEDHQPLLARIAEEETV